MRTTIWSLRPTSPSSSSTWICRVTGPEAFSPVGFQTKVSSSDGSASTDCGLLFTRRVARVIFRGWLSGQETEAVTTIPVTGVASGSSVGV
jgi:hypothetical protein